MIFKGAQFLILQGIGFKSEVFWLKVQKENNIMFELSNNGI